MRLFLYGSLLDTELLTALAGRSVPLTPATLCGWRRVALRDSRYPTLRRGRGVVEGALAMANRRVLMRLQAYEGPLYRLSPVMVRTPRGARLARAWIARGGTRRAWP
jgi:gamma-glutamylcyclotransferase (GGCT)/AIG2-like uncharacterized protein YtfP